MLTLLEKPRKGSMRLNRYKRHARKQMKKWKAKIALGLCFGLVLGAFPTMGGELASVKAESANLLENGSFEEQLGDASTGETEDRWFAEGLERTAYTDLEALGVSTPAGAGAYGMKMTYDVINDSGYEVYPALMQMKSQPLEAGVYKASAMLYADGHEGTVLLAMDGTAADGSIYQEVVQVPVQSGSWTTVEAYFTLDQQVRGAFLGIEPHLLEAAEDTTVSGGDATVSGGDAGSSNSGVVVFDNVVLERVVEDGSDSSGNGDSSGGSASSDSTSNTAAPIEWNEVEQQMTETLAEITANPQLENTNVNFVSAVGETMVPANILQTLQGQKVTAAFHNGKGVAMSITGTALNSRNMSGITALNLTVTCDEENLPENLVQEKTAAALQYRELSLKNAGEFQVPVNMHIAVNKEYAGKYANLYRYNTEENNFDYVSSFQITEDGQCMFGVSQGGEYLLTVTETRAE